MALIYQWQRRSGTGSWSDISGANSSSYTVSVSSTSSSYDYRVIVKSTLSNLQTASNSAKLSMKDNTPIIELQPKPVTVDEYSPAIITCRAHAPYGGVTYSWQYRENSYSSWRDSVDTGSKTRKLTVTGDASYNGRQYRCVVRSEAGGFIKYTGISTLTVNSPQPPVITSHPGDVRVGLGENYALSVSARGSSPLTYKWEYRNAGASSWAESAQTGNYVILTASYSSNGRRYRAVVSNAYGTVRSNEMTVRLK